MPASEWVGIALAMMLAPFVVLVIPVVAACSCLYSFLEDNLPAFMLNSRINRLLQRAPHFVFAVGYVALTIVMIIMMTMAVGMAVQIALLIW